MREFQGYLLLAVGVIAVFIAIGMRSWLLGLGALLAIVVGIWMVITPRRRHHDGPGPDDAVEIVMDLID
jgi:hypothetical protein